LIDSVCTGNVTWYYWNCCEQGAGEVLSSTGQNRHHIMGNSHLPDVDDNMASTTAIQSHTHNDGLYDSLLLYFNNASSGLLCNNPIGYQPSLV